MDRRFFYVLTTTACAAMKVMTLSATASSHREAPFVTEHPKVDATDFYMFRSYEEGRDGFVTLRVAMGVLCHAFPGAYCDPADAPSGLLPFTDGAIQRPSQFGNTFPYLTSPIPGSPR